MDKKIAKYKLKKNKLEEKIINLLETKKKLYEEQITNSNQKVNIEFINLIDDFVASYNLDKNSFLTIVVCGFYSVGKTTFITNIEKYIDMLLKIKKIKRSKNFIAKIDKIDKIENDNTNNEIEEKNSPGNVTIFETKRIDLDSKIYMQMKNTIYINVMPKDILSLKNKYINKIIIDIKNGTNDFIDNIYLLINEMKKINNLIEDNYIYCLKNHIELLRNKNELFDDDDFYFLDMFTEKIYGFVNKCGENKSNYFYDNSINVINYLI